MEVENKQNSQKELGMVVTGGNAVPGQRQSKQRKDHTG